jgi:HEAT repeat protein
MIITSAWKCGIPRLVSAAILVAAISVLAAPRGAAAQPQTPTDAQVKEQLQRLSPKTDKAVRLAALKWLDERSSAKSAVLAIPVLERCIREDPDRDVRCAALYTLGYIAVEQKKDCPLVLLQAMLDPDENFSLCAATCVGFFKTYPPGSVEILLRCARSKSADVRIAAVLTLLPAGGKEKRILDVIEKAKQDVAFEVRHNAHVAMFQADDNVPSYLGYMIRLREDPDGTLGPIDRKSEAGKRSLTHRNLARIANAKWMIEWGEKRADDFARALLKFLDDPSPQMRRGAASLIGAVVFKINPPGLKSMSDLESLSELLVGGAPKPANQPKGPPQRSNVAVRLEQLKVKERLRNLVKSDPDVNVRADARYALSRFATVEKKQE